MRIPTATLSPDALQGIVEAFVLREGTDYGHRDFTLEEKCQRVRCQLDRGEVEIWFDARTGTTDIRVVGAAGTGRGDNDRRSTT